MTEERIRYLRLGYVGLRVTDIARSVAYYRDLVGLKLETETPERATLRCSDKPYDMVLEKGDVAGLATVGLEVEDRPNLDLAFEKMESFGFNPSWTGANEAAAKQIEAGFTFNNPDTGMLVDIYVNQEKAATPYEWSVTNIARLGHVVVNVSDFEQGKKFWIDQLGFEISDHVPGKVAFLRTYPNPLHHSFALIAGERDGLNHVNFMVTDIDDIGKAMNRMKKADIPIVFGPGRHLPSTSIFLYFLDPDQMTTEYSFGMELIEEDGREPRVLEPKPEVLDTWGSLPDPRFGKKGEIIASEGGKVA